MKLYEYADNVTLPNGKSIDQSDPKSYPILYFDDKEFFIGDEGSTHMASLENHFYKIKNQEFVDIDPFDYDEKDNFLYTYLDAATFTGRVWLKHKVMAFWDLGIDVKSQHRLKDIIDNLEKEFNIKINPKEWWLEFSDTYTGIPYFVNMDDFIEGKNLKYGVMDSNTKVSSEVRKAWHLLNSAEKLKKKKEYGMDKFKMKAKPLPWKQALMKSESFITNFEQYNESIRDKMTPKISEEEIDELVSSMIDKLAKMFVDDGYTRNEQIAKEFLEDYRSVIIELLVSGKSIEDVYQFLPRIIDDDDPYDDEDLFNDMYESLRDQMKPKSKEELKKVMHLDGEHITNIPDEAYTEKEVKRIIKRFSKIFNKNFEDDTEFRVVDWYYMWNTKNLSLGLSKDGENNYMVQFSDHRDKSLKSIKRTFKEIGYKDYEVYTFRKKYNFLDNALKFLNDCGIDTSKITRK